MGLVIEVCPGEDEASRNVKLKLPRNKFLSRPLQKGTLLRHPD